MSFKKSQKSTCESHRRTKPIVVVTRGPPMDAVDERTGRTCSTGRRSDGINVGNTFGSSFDRAKSDDGNRERKKARQRISNKASADQKSNGDNGVPLSRFDKYRPEAKACRLVPTSAAVRNDAGNNHKTQASHLCPPYFYQPHSPPSERRSTTHDEIYIF